MQFAAFIVERSWTVSEQGSLVYSEPSWHLLLVREWTVTVIGGLGEVVIVNSCRTCYRDTQCMLP